MNNLEKTDKNIELMAKTSILVVDDTELNYLLICAILRKTEIDITWASNGYDAIEMLESGHQYDLVLMDYHMPGMNGIETAQQMRMVNQNMRFIVQTAAIDDDEFVNNCYKLNLDGKKFLYKELDKLNVEYQKTETNHIWLNSTIDSQEAFIKLQKQGIVIKPFSGNWIRVSIGTIENNKSFISSFKNLLE